MGRGTMSKKHECTRENIMQAYKARDFRRVLQSHPDWTGSESGKGDHHIEVYNLKNGGEGRVPWDGSHGEVSIGVRKSVVKFMTILGLLISPFVCAIVYLLGR